MRRGRRPKADKARKHRRPSVGRVDAKLPDGVIEQIDRLVADRIYLTRADFVRSAVREKLLSESVSAVDATVATRSSVSRP